MKNSDMPAMPMENARVVRNANDEVGLEGAFGLTKLEHASIAAMQGILASPNLMVDLGEKNIAKAAICQAKALLEELEKQQ